MLKFEASKNVQNILNTQRCCDISDDSIKCTILGIVTYAKVIKGQEIFASNDVDDEDGGPHIKDLFGVIGYDCITIG